jgi:predicted dehydrogenase
MNIGIVGAAGRGSSFKIACDACGDLNVHAVCDTNIESLSETRERLGAEEQYSDYYEMLEKSDIQAVVIGSPMQFHAEQSIAALERNIHVLCEVTAGISIEECKAVVAAANKSKAIYMMAENYVYMKNNALIKNLVEKGLFGDVYYAEGEYLHELKWLAEDTKWRRHFQMGIDGITYGTHSLGPILQWMPGDRVVKVCCEGTGTRHVDPRGDKYSQTSSVMLAKTAKGALIKIRIDLISDRPNAETNYMLQGTDGCYESSRRGPVDDAKIWFRELGNITSNERGIERIAPVWHSLDSIFNIDALADKYMPEIWRNPSKEAKQAGHGGGDYFEMIDFVKAAKGEIKCPIGIHEAMDMTLPGLVSQQSIKEDGRWIEVPDSRSW